MNATAIEAVERADSHLVEDSAQFFAPMASDLIDRLLGEYGHYRNEIDKVVAVMAGGLSNVMHYFIEGNCGDEAMHRSLYVEKLFCTKGAIAALNAAYWSKTLNFTDVLDCMPQKRRGEWLNQIRQPAGKKGRGGKWEIEPLPDYTEDSVRPTINGLLAMRGQFLAERVDGIFQGLSGEHVTNAPEGFGKRMIIARVLNEYHSSNSDTCGLINDLRAVVARFMGRDEPAWHATNSMIESLKANWGQWVSLDGGAIKIRIYKKGTAHMEIHPDMAWRLNAVLASLYPLAIPAQFRTKPKRRAKEFELLQRPLPFAVLAMLQGAKEVLEKIGGNGWRDEYRRTPNTRRLDAEQDTPARREAEAVLESIGGVRQGGKAYTWFQFPYEPTEALQAITTSGCVPDLQAHQYYPTPEKMAALAVELADISDEDECAEPSAGQGGIADHMPKDRTTCVEISPLHCAVLRAKGFKTVEADFIGYAEQNREKFSVVVMNPPFSEGRAQLHAQSASAMLKVGGRLVAILPATLRGKNFLAGNWSVAWSAVYANEFAGTSAAVAILKAVRLS